MMGYLWSMVIYPLVTKHTYGKHHPFYIIGKSTISMANFNSYICLPEGIFINIQSGFIHQACFQLSYVKEVNFAIAQKWLCLCPIGWRTPVHQGPKWCRWSSWTVESVDHVGLSPNEAWRLNPPILRRNLALAVQDINPHKCISTKAPNNHVLKNKLLDNPSRKKTG